MAAPALEVNGLVKRYGPTQALDGVSFRVDEGEVFGLLGPNGAGKTTLLSIVSGLLECDAGSVHMLGEPVRASELAWRRKLGLVPQELALYGELTARENLRFFGELFGMGGAELKQRIDEVLAAVALSDRADRLVDTFSGGMKRRLNLGVALMHRPKVLLLDEPTTGVDPQSRNHIFEEVRRINADGVTVVYTSHYMEEVQTLCRRIGIIDQGKLIACDTLPGLLRQLSGLIRVRVLPTTDTLLQRIRALPGVRLSEADGTFLHLECAEVKDTLLRLLALLNELQLSLESIETEEPNLERVFLHLTGRGLRD